mgnify:CR=1 FL=1
MGKIVNVNTEASKASKTKSGVKLQAKDFRLLAEPITIVKIYYLIGGGWKIDYCEIKTCEQACVEFMRAQNGIMETSDDLHRENQAIIVVALAETVGISPAEMSKILLNIFTHTKGEEII